LRRGPRGRGGEGRAALLCAPRPAFRAADVSCARRVQVRGEGGAGGRARAAGGGRDLRPGRAGLPGPACLSHPCVTLPLPRRTDEPVLGRTLDVAWASWQAAPQARTHALEVIVCLNGPAGDSRALADLRAFAAARGAPLAEADADAAPVAPAAAAAVTALCTRRAGKAIAWELLRRRARGETVLFLDADVSFPGDTLGLLLGTLAARRDAVLASARTA